MILRTYVLLRAYMQAGCTPAVCMLLWAYMIVGAHTLLEAKPSQGIAGTWPERFGGIDPNAIIVNVFKNI